MYTETSFSWIKTPNNGYPFPPKWPLKMGTGLAASAAHPRRNQIWVPPPPPPGNANVVLPGTHRFARCMLGAPTSTHRQFLMCMIYFSKAHTKQDFCSSNIISCNFIHNTHCFVFLIVGFFFRSSPSAENKKSVHFAHFPAGRTPLRTSGRHTKYNNMLPLNSFLSNFKLDTFM